PLWSVPCMGMFKSALPESPATLMEPPAIHPGLTGEPRAVCTRGSRVATAIACLLGSLALMDENTATRMPPMNKQNSRSSPSTMETTIQITFLDDERGGGPPANGAGPTAGGGGTDPEELMAVDCTMHSDGKTLQQFP